VTGPQTPGPTRLVKKGDEPSGKRIDSLIEAVPESNKHENAVTRK